MGEGEMRGGGSGRCKIHWGRQGCRPLRKKVVQDESIKKGEQYTISSDHLQEDIKKWNEDFMEADT